jgi:hypothetical protein
MLKKLFIALAMVAALITPVAIASNAEAHMGGTSCLPWNGPESVSVTWNNANYPAKPTSYSWYGNYTVKTLTVFWWVWNGSSWQYEGHTWTNIGTWSGTKSWTPTRTASQARWGYVAITLTDYVGSQCNANVYA